MILFSWSNSEDFKSVDFHTRQSDRTTATSIYCAIASIGSFLSNRLVLGVARMRDSNSNINSNIEMLTVNFVDSFRKFSDIYSCWTLENSLCTMFFLHHFNDVCHNFTIEKGSVTFLLFLHSIFICSQRSHLKLKLETYQIRSASFKTRIFIIFHQNTSYIQTTMMCFRSSYILCILARASKRKREKFRETSS